ncbi:MAG TPA: hypothetical protein VJU78_18630 [Chitinophagaceae bacterium]|nr:hypothetical protein [Chitinophagaceae bacterium]
MKNELKECGAGRHSFTSSIQAYIFGMSHYTVQSLANNREV